jgi:cell division protein FtsB
LPFLSTIDDRLYRLKREAGRHWLGILLLLTLGYFAYHSIHGSRGLFAWVDRNHELELKRLELDAIRDQRQWLGKRVLALGAPAGDQGIAVDLLEETLYELGFVYENELVILDPQTAD